MHTDKIRATECLTYDIILALCYPDKQSENPLVRELFKFLTRPIMAENVRLIETAFSKVSTKDLSAVIDEAGKLIRESERKLWIAASICTKNPGRHIREFFSKEAIDHFLIVLLPIFAVAYKERIKRRKMIQDKQVYSIGPALAAQVHLRDKNPSFMRKVDSILGEALGIRYTSEIDKALENDVVRVKRAIRGMYESKKTVVKDNYYKYLKKACDSKLSGLTEGEVIAIMLDEDKFKFSRLPKTVFQRSIDQITPAHRIRQRRYRLNKQGLSKEDIKRITDQEWRGFYNKEFPSRVVEFTTRDDNQERDNSKQALEIVIVEYTKRLSPQAKPQKRLGEFLIEKIKADEIWKYVRYRDNEGKFRIKEIHKDSALPLKTIERFCKGLWEFGRQNDNLIR